MFVKAAPLIFVFLWATGFIGAKFGMPFSEPGTFLAIRFAIAFLLVGALAGIARAKWPGLKLGAQAVCIGILIHGVYLGGVFWAIDRSMPAGVAAVIVGVQPLLTALLAGWWLREVITRQHWIALGIGLAGVILVVWPKLTLTGLGITPMTIFACLLGMVSVTIGTVWQKSTGGKIDLRSGTALQYLGAVIPVFLLSLFTETRQIIWSAEMIFAMVWAIFVLSIGAVILLMWLIREGSVAQVSSLMYLVPAVSALMAFFLFDEQLTPIQILGMAICAAGVAMASMNKSPPKAPPKTL